MLTSVCDCYIDRPESEAMLGIGEVDMDDGDLQRQYEREDREFRNFAVALKLSVTYASNVGGLGTIIGCGPNIIFKGQAEAYVFIIYLLLFV